MRLCPGRCQGRPARLRGGKGDLAVQGGADGEVAELGEGGQGGVPADPLEGPQLGLVPAECILPGLERFFYRPAPPAIVMKNVMVAGVPSGAWQR
jgi:hypothetical protein